MIRNMGVSKLGSLRSKSWLLSLGKDHTAVQDEMLLSKDVLRCSYKWHMELCFSNFTVHEITWGYGKNTDSDLVGFMRAMKFLASFQVLLMRQVGR